MRRRFGRRKFLLTGAAALGAAGLGWGCGAEPRWIELTQVPVALRRPWPGRVRILHLSDLHLSAFVPLSFLEDAFRQGLETAPDLICLTGDFVTSRDGTSLDGYAGALSLLSSAAPTFAVFGNHDGGPWSRKWGGDATVDRVAEVLAESGVEILHNRSTDLETRGGTVRLAGVGDLWGDECEPGRALRGRGDDAAPIVFLAHNPDTKDLAAGNEWDIMLSGHTHGGQVVLPLVGAPFAPVEDRRFVAGLHSWKERWIYTTRGLGSIFGLRVNCRPEITVLDLTGTGPAPDARADPRADGEEPGA